MKRTERRLLWLVAILGSTAGLCAEVSDATLDNPYRVIVERNPFGLRPPVVATPAEQPKPPAPKQELYLTGITTLLGPKTAFFQVGKTNYFSLKVDEKRDELEVLEIDEVNRTVKIKQSGVETLMSFTTHGLKAPNAPATPPPGTPGGPPMPGAPGMNPVGSGAPGATALPGTIPAINTGSGIRNIPSRTLRAPGEGADVNPQANNFGNTSYGLQPGQTANQGRTVTAQHQYPQQNMSAEEQVLMLELQKASHPNVPLPPTPGLGNP